MTHENAAARQHKPHVLPLKIYAGVWIGLLLLTVVTVKASYLDFGVFNLVVAMGIATLKATLVALFFMHLKYDEPLNVIVFVGSLAFLAVFFMFTLADTMERGQVDPLERGLIEAVPARAAQTAGEGHESSPADHESSPGGTEAHETGAETPGGEGAVEGETSEESGH